jgi:xanthine/CO dehydrogenase XdhC/CoxF family maturation factor
MLQGSDLGLRALFEFIGEHADASLVLATVIDVEGSTYRKPGAMVLLTDSAEAVGLVSGGCLETDLCERAAPVRQDGNPRRIEYDLREDDPLWGLGLGRGRLQLLLEPANADNGFAGLADIEPHWRSHRRIDLLKSVRGHGDTAPGQRWLLAPGEAPPVGNLGEERSLSGGSVLLAGPQTTLIRIPVLPPPRLLICGAGPDALPLADAASAIGWDVIVYDHRPAYAQAARFPGAHSVVCAAASSLSEQDWLRDVDAAVVMSHHLASDTAYVRALADTDLAYVGLLGPAARGAELLSAASVTEPRRFFSPAGLDIGSEVPETIALSILSEAHAVLRGRDGRSLRGLVR